MGSGVALTATGAVAVTGRNKAPAATTDFRNHVSLSSDICDNRKGSSFDSLFLSVPSRAEVQLAISSLRSFMQGISLSGTELSWLYPILSHYHPTLSQSPGFQRVKDALLLLENNQSIQSLVLSLSSDKSVWDAVLKNKFLGQLREPLKAAKLKGSPGHNKEGDLFAIIGRWIMDLMKAKVVELVDKFKSLVDEFFDSAPQKNRRIAESRERLEEKLKSSVLLSIIILLIVVVTRASHLP